MKYASLVLSSLLALVLGAAAPARADKPPEPKPAAPAAAPAAKADPKPAPAAATGAAKAPVAPVAKPAKVAKPYAAQGKWKSLKVTGTLDGKSQTAAVLVYTPKAPADDASKKFPLVLALHGWNHTPEMFRDKGDLARYADQYGLVLAVPAMGKTVYETAFYPESKKKWGAIPGTRWVGEIVLPYLRKNLPVYDDRAHTAVIGYSTGGRGALLLAEAYPEFAYAGSSSGTFDLMRLDPKDGEYKIHAVIYGPREQFKDRWELDNVISPARLERLAGTAVFAAHSGQDVVVKPDQLEALREATAAGAATKAPGGPVIALVPEGGAHDWPFWVSQWDAMFRGLSKTLGLTK